MATFTYDDGTDTPAVIEATDGEFEYVHSGDHWLIKLGEEDGQNLMKMIPNHRLFDIEGLRTEIRYPRP